MSEDRKHHSYSPSTLQSLEACPCYKSRQDVVHERTIIGTIAHKAAETGQDDARLTDEDALLVAQCLDFVESRRALAEKARQDAKSNNLIIEIKEAYLPIDDEIFEDEYRDPLTGKTIKETVHGTTAGYIDHAIISHDRTYAELIDFKFGKWAVEKAENNLQGIAYALGLLKAYPSLRGVRFFFKQPLIDEISHHYVAREAVKELHFRISVIVARARAARKAGDFATARPMYPLCSFCALLGACPKVAEFACKVGSKFSPLKIPAEITPSLANDPANTKLGLELAAVMKVWSEAYRQQVNDRVLRGDAAIPEGYTITTRSDREIVNREKFREITLKYVSESDYLAALGDPAFGPIEKRITENAPRGSKAAAVEAYKAELIESGAVEKQIPVSYLRAVATKKEKEGVNENS